LSDSILGSKEKSGEERGEFEGDGSHFDVRIVINFN